VFHLGSEFDYEVCLPVCLDTPLFFFVAWLFEWLADCLTPTVLLAEEDSDVLY